MKDLKEYMNNKYVSLKGLDADVVEKLKNLDGTIISECCGCCGCDCGCDSCACDIPCEEPCACPGTLAKAEPYIDPVSRCKEKFYCSPKVYDLLDAHTTLDYKCRFLEIIQGSFTEPVLFYDSMTPICGYDRSKKLRDDILTLCGDFELLWPVVMFRNNGDIQLFAAKKFGSNGQECSIKSSLIEAADILTKLEKRKEVQWAQVLDVSIDNLDDLYDFLFTVTFDKEKYDKELEEIREKDEKKALKEMPKPANTL